MARNFRGSRPAGRARPALLEWADVVTHLAGPGVTTKTVAATTAIGGAVNFAATLVRTRGDLLCQFDPANIADIMQVGIGLAVVSADAFAIGSTAVPGPLTDADWTWIYHRLVTFGPAIAAAQTETALPQHARIEVDSKAMRKVKPNEVIAWVAESIVLSGGGSLDVFVTARHLFKIN